MRLFRGHSSNVATRAPSEHRELDLLYGAHVSRLFVSVRQKRREYSRRCRAFREQIDEVLPTPVPEFVAQGRNLSAHYHYVRFEHPLLPRQFFEILLQAEHLYGSESPRRKVVGAKMSVVSQVITHASG